MNGALLGYWLPQLAVGGPAAVALVLICSYLLGSIPFALLIGRWVGGVDIRTRGSRNVGATNVGRQLGLGWGLLVFALDFLKGLGPVALVGALLPERELAPLAAAAGAILGHVFSIFLGGKGGKGVATSAGALALLTPWGLLASLAVWAVLLGCFRIMSVASLGASVALVAATWLLSDDLALGVFCSLLGVLVFWRHRSNLVRLFGRRELGLRPGASHQNSEKVPDSCQR